MSGTARSQNMPTALTTTSASMLSPPASRSTQTERTSSHTADSTSCSKRIGPSGGSKLYLTAMEVMYSRISGCGA